MSSVSVIYGQNHSRDFIKMGLYGRNHTETESSATFGTDMESRMETRSTCILVLSSLAERLIFQPFQLSLFLAVFYHAVVYHIL